MQRIVLTSCVAVLALVLLVGPAWAGPDAGSMRPILPKAERPTTLFGYAGKRPLDPTRTSGIARPTPAPRIETAAFGAATACLPAKPKLVTPSPAPRFAAASNDVIVVCDRADGSCCPPSRIDDDPLSVSPHHWSSGYHDGKQVTFRDPCQPRCSQPVYRSPCEPCDPCDTCSPCDPCAEPCTTRVVVRRPVRVVRRACVPCYRPWRPVCGPRIRFGIAPYWGWGWGIGWGGCW